MRTPSFLTVLAVVVLAAPAAALDLPTAEVTTAMASPNPLRLRITVTRDGITIRPGGGTTERKVTSLVDWTVAASDLSEGRIQSLSAALEPADHSPRVGPPPPENGVDGWADLWIDRAAPWALAELVFSTAGRWTVHFGLAMKTPSGDRTVSVSLPVLDGNLAEAFPLGVEAGQLYAGGQAKPVKATPAAVRNAVKTFEKSRANARLSGPPDARVCTDGRGARLDDEKCWRGRVVTFAAGSKTLWGEVVPLVVAAQDVIPDVSFSRF